MVVVVRQVGGGTNIMGGSMLKDALCDESLPKIAVVSPDIHSEMLCNKMIFKAVIMRPVSVFTILRRFRAHVLRLDFRRFLE